MHTPDSGIRDEVAEDKLCREDHELEGRRPSTTDQMLQPLVKSA